MQCFATHSCAVVGYGDVGISVVEVGVNLNPGCASGYGVIDHIS